MENNMKALLIATLAVGTVVSTPALASLELAKAKNCMACHSVDKKVLGPAYKEIAAKYADKKDAESYLAQKIIKGSQGVWGAVPMPPNATVTEKEANELAKWTLSLK